MCIIYISVGWRSAEGKDYILPTQSPWHTRLTYVQCWYTQRIIDWPTST